MKSTRQTLLAACVSAAILSPAAQAGPHGFDTHNTFAPASGALAGTSIAKPQDTVSAVFGNPATLTQFQGTQFTFGGTFFKPTVKLTHDGSVTGTAFSGTSGTDIFPVPEIAVTQDLSGLGMPATLGLGITALSGLGSEFRGTAGSLGAGGESVTLGINGGLGYVVTDNLSIGGAATISFSELDIGLSSSSAMTHDLGIRGTVGATYVMGDTTIGGFYQTALKHDYDNMVETAPGVYVNVAIEQPANIGIGLANNSLMGGDLLLMADVIHKYWRDADFWGDIYDDQTVYSVGAQLTRGKVKYRIGYGFAEEPTRSDAHAPVGPLTQINSAYGVIPLSDPVVQYLQATQTAVLYEHRLTVGVGIDDVLMPGLTLDLAGGYEFKEDRDYGTGSLPGGGHTQAETKAWQVGFALTWKFL